MHLSRRNVLCSFTALPALHLASRGHGATLARVFNGYELQSVLDSPVDGDEIVLAAGNYGDMSGLLRITASHVTLRAEPGAVIYGTEIEVLGHGTVLDGLSFIGGPEILPHHEPDTHPWVFMAAVIENRSGSAKITVSGTDTEVRNCDLSGFSRHAVYISGKAVRPYVHHNRIHDASSSGPPVYVANSTRWTDKDVAARIEQNTFSNLSGSSSETIGVKCSSNRIVRNTFTNCNNLTNRHGENNVWEENQLDRCKGIVIHDQGNIVRNNTVSNNRVPAGIRLMTGSARWNAPVQGTHPNAANTLCEGNTAVLRIGDQTNNKAVIKVENTRVISNIGKIVVTSMAVGTQLPGAAAKG